MKKLPEILKSISSGVVAIVVIYLAFGLSWITFSDALIIALFADADIEFYTAIQTSKGYTYVILTSIVLLLLINNFARRLKTALEQQQESGNILKKLVEEVGVSIARLDLDGRFTYANPDCCQFFGMTEEELLQKNFFDLTHPDDVAQDRKCWNKILKREIADFKNEKRFLNNFNQIHWAQEKVSIVEDNRRDPKYLVLVIHDINHLKKAESNLEESIRYYQTVLENSFDGVSIIDEQGNVKYQTPSVERIIGYSKSSRMGESVLSFIAPEDLPKVQTIFGQLVANIIPEARTVVKYLRGDGEMRYLDLYTKNMLSDPLVKGIVVNFRDITDKFIIESKLRESEEQYKLLFLNNPIPVFIYDPKTLNYLQVNDAAVKQYGYTREEFLTMNLKDIRPKEDIPKILEDIAKIDEDITEGSKIWRHLTKDGQIKYVEISAVSINYSGQKARMSIANDVTYIINGQEQIRQSEERYRHLVENLPAGAVLIQGEDIYFNKAVSEITGYTLEEIDSLDTWFERLYGQDAKLLKQFYYEDQQNNFGVPRTVALTTKDGSKRWVTFYAYKFETGEVWLIQDITERKKMDELIISSMLEAEDRERKRIAEELHDGLGHLLGSASSQLDLVLKENLPQQQHDQLLSSSQFLQQAIQENRNITANLIPLKLGEENIITTLEGLFAQFQKSTGISLSFRHDIAGINLNTSNANNLYRIAQEALSNILKYSQAKEVNVALIYNEDGLQFNIVDNGKGFTQQQPAGGMGLSNISNRVKAMGGTLKINSTPGAGTAINVSMPFFL